MLEFRNTRFALRIVRTLELRSRDEAEDYLEKIGDYDFFGRPADTDYTNLTLDYSVDGYTVKDGILVREDSFLPILALKYIS